MYSFEMFSTEKFMKAPRSLSLGLFTALFLQTGASLAAIEESPSSTTKPNIQTEQTKPQATPQEAARQEFSCGDLSASTKTVYAALSDVHKTEDAGEGKDVMMLVIEHGRVISADRLFVRRSSKDIYDHAMSNGPIDMKYMGEGDRQAVNRAIGIIQQKCALRLFRIPLPN
jgi:hypothetical protein